MIRMLVVPLAVAVAVAAACRLNKVRLQEHRAGWVFSYLLCGLYAALEIHDAMLVEARLSALVGLSAVGLWIWGSRSTWRGGAPDWMRRRS